MVISFFWDAERPIGSIVWTLFSLMVTYNVIKITRGIMWMKKMAGLFPSPPYELMMGNFPDMEKVGGFGLKYFKDMHAKYGPIFGFFMPFGDFHISIDRPEALQIVHKKASERPDSTFKVVNYLFKENVLFQHGAWQKEMRRSYQSIVNDPIVHAKLHQMAWDSLEKAISGWGGRDDVDVYGTFEPMISDVMGNVLFGQSWSEVGKGQTIMKNHLFCAHNVMKWAFLPVAPIWNKDYRDYANAKQAFWDDIDQMLEIQRKKLAAGKVDPTCKDVYALLLTAKKEDGTLFYDRPTAVSTMMVFLNGSFDTTLNSTCWTLYWLAKHPEYQKKLQEELDKKLPSLKTSDQPPEKEKLSPDELPYLEAVIRESMRRMPAAPINMRVNLDADYEIEGIGKIPKGVTVICPYENSMMKEDVFGEDCAVFNPDRWVVGDEEKIKKMRMMWTPFGDHSRMCVGRNFALVEIRLFLSRIVSKYTFSLKDPDQEVTALYEAGINIINPKPQFVFKQR